MNPINRFVQQSHKKPFFVFDLQNYDERQVTELARFQKASFDMDGILEAASNLKYVKAGAAIISKQLTEPDDDFVRFIGKQIYEGSLTKGALEMLRPAIQSALDEVIRNRIQERLGVAFGKDAPAVEPQEKKDAPEAPEQDIITTEDEQQAFMIVRAIGSKVIPLSRITMRDAKSYCSIFVDDNNRKPVCRLYFNGKSTRTIGLFDANKVESKQQIDDLSDLYKFSDQISEAIAAYV